MGRSPKWGVRICGPPHGHEAARCGWSPKASQLRGTDDCDRPVCAGLPAARARRHRIRVSYELRALAGLREVAAQAAEEAGAAAVELPQGYALVPITARVFDRLGGGQGKPFGDTFLFLSSSIEALARRVSRTSPIAYLEAELFGGAGTQATVVWRDGEVWAGPAVTEFGWHPPDPASSPQWAFNQALRNLGVDRGDAFDEFDALSLGQHRHTEQWLG